MIIPMMIMNLVLLCITFLLILADKVLIGYAQAKLVINKEKVISTEAGETLLNLLTTKRIFVPSACGGKATCGQCKIKVLSGAGKILPTEEIFINHQEKGAGFRLACQVKLRGDLEIYLPEYLLETKEYLGKVIEIKPLTYDIKYLKIKLISSEINFKPGQYIQLKIPGTEEYRAYSIASPDFTKDYLELIIRLIPGGLCSTYVHKVLEENDNVVFTGPFGEFFLREDSLRQIICIGGGCGMAPLRSIIYSLAKKNMPRKVIFFFGARAKRDLFYTEELKDLEKKFPNFRYIPALSEPQPQDRWEGDTGLITQVVERYIHKATDTEAYLCGPPPMIDAAIKVLTKRGLEEKYIYYDKF